MFSYNTKRSALIFRDSTMQKLLRHRNTMLNSINAFGLKPMKDILPVNRPFADRLARKGLKPLGSTIALFIPICRSVFNI